MPSNGAGGRPSVYTKWLTGSLQFLDSTGAVIFTVDKTRKLTMPTGATLDVSLATVTGGIGGSLGTAATEAQGASITIATATVSHRIATDGSNFSGASNVAFDAAGTDGQLVFLEFVNAASDGNTVLTFTTNAKSSGTATIAQAKTANFIFKSNGTNFVEVSRLLTIAN